MRKATLIILFFLIPQVIYAIGTNYRFNGKELDPISDLYYFDSRYYNPNFGDDDIDSKTKVERAGIPGVQRVFFLGRPNFKVVALKQMYRGHVDDVIRVLVPGGEQYSGHHIWVLVDDDIDVTHTAEVLWAIAGRCAPETGVQVVPGTAFWQLDPRVRPDDRSNPAEGGRKSYIAHNLVINACRPFDWIKDFPPVCVNGPELRKRIEEKWKKLFV